MGRKRGGVYEIYGVFEGGGVQVKFCDLRGGSMKNFSARTLKGAKILVRAIRGGGANFSASVFWKRGNPQPMNNDRSLSYIAPPPIQQKS